MTTNDEIINKHFPRTKEGFDIENVRDSINALMNRSPPRHPRRLQNSFGKSFIRKQEKDAPCF